MKASNSLVVELPRSFWNLC